MNFSNSSTTLKSSNNNYLKAKPINIKPLNPVAPRKLNQTCDKIIQ